MVDYVNGRTVSIISWRIAWSVYKDYVDTYGLVWSKTAEFIRYIMTE